MKQYFAPPKRIRVREYVGVVLPKKTRFEPPIKPSEKRVAGPRRGIPTTIPCPRCRRQVSHPKQRHHNTKGRWCSGKARAARDRERDKNSVLIRYTKNSKTKIIKLYVYHNEHLLLLKKILGDIAIKHMISFFDRKLNEEAAKKLYRTPPDPHDVIRENIMQSSKLTKPQRTVICKLCHKRMIDCQCKPKITFDES